MTAIHNQSPLALSQLEQGRSLASDAWRRFVANRTAFICGLIFFGIILLCFLGPWFCPWDPNVPDDSLAKAAPPSARHWMGTDDLGRDLLARILTGGQVSILVGLAATFVSLIIGVTWGSLAGYLGGKVDALLMRIVDVLYGLPFIILVILLRLMLDAEIISSKLGINLVLTKLLLLLFTIGVLEWMTMARIVRGQVQALARMEFVEAAQCLGLSTPRIIWKHILPNTLGPVIVYTTLTIPAVMLLEASLSFLGLGVEPPQSSWGLLIKDGAASMETYWWRLFFPTCFFAATLFCLNFMGDGLRHALDVRAAKD